MPGDAPVNTGDPELEYAFYQAERRVLEIQAKLHRWACDDPDRRFGDLFNLVTDPDFLLVAWVRVRGNKGGQDGRGGPPHGGVRRGGRSRRVPRRPAVRVAGP